MGPRVVFRFQAFADRFSLRAGQPLTPKLAAGILIAQAGSLQGLEGRVTIIPFINKVDNTAQDAAARDLALLILRNGNFPVRKVLFAAFFVGGSIPSPLPGNR